MRRVGRDRPIAAHQLVLALGTCLHARQAGLDRIIYRLVVADLEVQAGVMFDSAPVAAVKTLAAQDIEGAGYVTALAPSHDKQATCAHGFAQK